jgi:DNA-binding GntR family transcriptional regulator
MKTSETNNKSIVDNIDRTLNEPAYIQVANLLRNQISAGLFRGEDKLPSEAQLCEKYGVSPMTVRRSINLLIDQNVVHTSKGQGTFVKPLELSSATFDLKDFKILFDENDGSSVNLLDVRTMPADERIARKLDLVEGEKVVYLRRVISRNNEPICYHRAYLVYAPDQPIIEAEMDVTSLQGLFTSVANTMLKRAKITIQSALMNEEEAEILDSPLPAATFILEHVFFNFEDKPTSWGWFVFRDEQLSLSTNVGIGAPA